MQERRILVVEDDANDAELTLRALARLNLGDKVDVTRDGQEALECRGTFAARSSGDPAVVLMDVKMPRLSGLEALERAAAHSLKAKKKCASRTETHRLAGTTCREPHEVS
jgi:CheY-like chemotaxis protein